MFLLFDIGGTNTRLSLSEDGISLGQIKAIPTSRNFVEAIAFFKQTALELIGGRKISGAAGGVRALDMKTKDRLVDHPNFPLWGNEPLKQELEKILQTPVYLENDAAMAGLGEALLGSGKGNNIVAYLTISTGIGGAKIEHGKIDETSMGFEPGNQIIDVDASLSPKVDLPGYFERYVSGDAIEKRYAIRSQDLSDPQIWDEIARILAAGINNVIVFWSPDIVVLGGSVTKSLPLDLVTKYLAEILKIFPQPPKLVKASLGDEAGLYGALEYLKQQKPL